jgi:hypothetical protein
MKEDSVNTLGEKEQRGRERKSRRERKWERKTEIREKS